MNTSQQVTTLQTSEVTYTSKIIPTRMNRNGNMSEQSN